MDPGILIERYVPESVLRTLARDRGIRLAEKIKPEIVEDLVESIGLDEAWALLDDHFEVGRGSVYWYAPHGAHRLKRSFIDDRLREYCGHDPFDHSAHLQVDRSQNIVCARWLEDQTLLIYFARVRRQSIIEDLERRIIRRTILSTAFLRMDVELLECWGDFETARITANVMAEALGLSGFVSQAILANEVQHLLSVLDARLVTDRFKDDEGRYDVIELVKRPETRSLEEEPEYVERHAGKPHIRKVVEFDVPNGQSDVRMEITKAGGFRFYAYTRRDVIDYVLQKLRGVKNP